MYEKDYTNSEEEDAGFSQIRTGKMAILGFPLLISCKRCGALASVYGIKSTALACPKTETRMEARALTWVNFKFTT
jgi:hypothetical protein